MSCIERGLRSNRWIGFLNLQAAVNAMGIFLAHLMPFVHRISVLP